jgi:hypothetical protein
MVEFSSLAVHHDCGTQAHGEQGQFYLTLKDSESAGLSVFKHSSADGFQIFTVLLELPLASCPWIDHATARTQSLPFS